MPVVLKTSGAPSAWKFTPLHNAELDTGGTTPPTLDVYPFMFQLGDAGGNILMAGGQSPYFADYPKARKLNRSQGVWVSEATFSPSCPIQGSSAVMYRRDVIMKAGGGREHEAFASNRAFKLDCTAANPQWVELEEMHTPRSFMYLIAMPSGHVLCVGGDAGIKPEWYDPYSNAWTQLAIMSKKRDHHASAVLMPDGSVFVAGGDNLGGPGGFENRDFQIFRPPYFYSRNVRPIIGGVNVDVIEDTIWYGEAFDAWMVRSGDVTAVRLIRSGAATHQFDHNQRCIELDYTLDSASNVVHVSAPSTVWQAPPGWYMLFVCNGPNGSLPSEGHWVQLADGPQPL